MSPRRLLIALFASWLMVPVSCTLVMVPSTRLLVASTARDLQAGEKPYLPPMIPTVDTATRGEVELVPLDLLATRRAQSPTLTAWLPEPTGSAGENEDRSLWRPIDSNATARQMELVEAKDTHTHFFRYAVAKDGSVTPLRSTIYDMSHPFLALALGFVLALLLRWWAARTRRRMAAAEA